MKLKIQSLQIFSFIFFFSTNLLIAQDLPTIYPLEEDSSYLFEMNFNYKKNAFSGVLIVKKEAEDKLRTTLTSKFGMKVFDFQLSVDSIETIYLVEQLDKNIIKKLYYKDMQMIFPFLFNPSKIRIKPRKIVLKKKCKKIRYRYDSNIYAVNRGFFGHPKSEVEFEENKLSSVLITHPIINLKIRIKSLKTNE